MRTRLQQPGLCKSRGDSLFFLCRGEVEVLHGGEVQSKHQERWGQIRTDKDGAQQSAQAPRVMDVVVSSTCDEDGAVFGEMAAASKHPAAASLAALSSA